MGTREELGRAIAQLLGKPCWGVRRIHGSVLSLEFGEPRLSIREPSVATSASPRVRVEMARRRVTPHGEWYLCFELCHWRIAHGEAVVDDDCSHDAIDAAAHKIDGQQLVALSIDAENRAATFSFDLGANLTAWPCEAGEAEQWWLYTRDGDALTYRADGRYALAAGKAKDHEKVWRLLSQDLRIP